MVCHVPARFKAEHNCDDTDCNPAENCKQMQTSRWLREKLHPAEINRRTQSGIRDYTHIGVRKLGSGANAEQRRERHDDR